MNNLAGTLSVQGDLGGARKLQEETLAVCRRVLGAEHPNTLTSMNNLADTLSAQGDLVGRASCRKKRWRSPPGFRGRASETRSRP